MDLSLIREKNKNVQKPTRHQLKLMIEREREKCQEKRRKELEKYRYWVQLLDQGLEVNREYSEVIEDLYC